MAKLPTWLLEYKSNTFSQEGEDGIIRKILEIIPLKDNWCVEFGAWDGLFLSNTRNLIENYNYKAVFIEGNKRKYKELAKNYEKNPRVSSFNIFVGFEPEDNLDHILSRTSIPLDFDFLSIDIDGNDFHVWKAMKKYNPKVINIEYNPTIPTCLRFVQKPDSKVSQGASLLTLIELGKDKGYELISVLPFNAFFVKSEYFHLFDIETNSPELMRVNFDYMTYLFVGYDGKVFIEGFNKLPWHNLKLNVKRIQPLPRFLRKHPNDYSKFEKIILKLYLLIFRPVEFIKKYRKTKSAIS